MDEERSIRDRIDMIVFSACHLLCSCVRFDVALKSSAIVFIALSRISWAQEGAVLETPKPESAEQISEQPEHGPDALAESEIEFLEDSSGISWSIVPYVWFLGIDGDVGIDDIDSDIDINFVDVLTDSDSLYGFMAHIEANTPQWSLFLRTTYAHVGFDDVTDSLGPIDLSVDVTADIGWFKFGGALPLIGSPEGPVESEHESDFGLDVYGGVRLTLIQLELDASAEIRGVPLTRVTEDVTEVWAEPFIGLRTRADLTDRISIYVRGDIGGFGAGSDFAWQARAIIGYRIELFGNPSAGFFGYSALSQDYENDGFKWDVIAHGPLLGFEIRF